MKTIDEIIQQEPVYLNNWSHKIDVIGDYKGLYMNRDEYEAKEPPYGDIGYWKEKKAEMDNALKEFESVNILFASYGEDNYTGDAWVLFEKEGKLFEVSGSHCSCYGLEGQWEPEEVMIDELHNRLTKGTFGIDEWSGNEFKNELCAFLGINSIINS